MDLIVTEKVRQKLTQKYEIHPDKTWSVDECKKVLGASIRKNNVKDIICCYREFSLTLATQQSQRNSELEKQNDELRAKISTLTKEIEPQERLEPKLMWELVSLITFTLIYKHSLKQM